MLGELVRAVLERALESELTAHLGYEKGGRGGAGGGNARNGNIAKTVQTPFPGRCLLVLLVLLVPPGGGSLPPAAVAGPAECGDVLRGGRDPEGGPVPGRHEQPAHCRPRVAGRQEDSGDPLEQQLQRPSPEPAPGGGQRRRGRRRQPGGA